MAVAAYALVTLEELLTHLRLKPPSQEPDHQVLEQLLEPMIDAASLAIEKRCKSIMVQRTLTQRDPGGLNGQRGGAKRIYVSPGPIASVTSVVDDAANAVAADWFTVFGAESYIEHHATWPRPFNATGGPGLFTITYVGGRFASRAAVDANLKLACNRLAALFRDNPAASVQFKRVGPLSVSYAAPTGVDGDGPFPLEIEGLLLPYVSH